VRRLVLTAVAATLLAACSQEPTTENQASEAASPQTTTAATAEPEGLAPAFSLTDAEGTQRLLADFRGRTVVLEWTNEGCPYVQKHYGAGAMQALQREATANGVVWLTIVSSAPGAQGFVEGDAARAFKAKHQAAYTHLLLDPTGEVGKLYEAKTTPDMRVIDPQGRVVYEGGIDDRPTNRVEDLDGATNFVRAALTDMEAGRPVQTRFAQPYGCSIKYPETMEG
jgi:peroxiredoxin